MRILTLVNLDRKIAPFHKNFHTNDEGEVSSKFPYLKFNEYVETKESSKLDDFIKNNFIVFSVKEEDFTIKVLKHGVNLITKILNNLFMNLITHD